MTNRPFVSVIMPAYNCSSYIKKAIESVLDQTYDNFELLIADDVSTDDTKAIINSFSDQRIKCFHNHENKGYVGASNLLMQQAKGDFIVFQDADDYAVNTRFEKLLNVFANDSELFAVSSDVIYCDPNDKEINRSDFPKVKADIYEWFKKFRIPLVGSAIMFKKAVLSTVGIYNEFFHRIGSEDMYWFSLVIQKHKVYSLNEHLYYYRTNPESVSHRNVSYRAVAGFDTCVYYMKEREAGRTDHIMSGEWEKANDIMRRFFISYHLIQKKTLSFKEIRNISPGISSALKFYVIQAKQRFLN